MTDTFYEEFIDQVGPRKARRTASPRGVDGVPPLPSKDQEPISIDASGPTARKLMKNRHDLSLSSAQKLSSRIGSRLLHPVVMTVLRSPTSPSEGPNSREGILTSNPIKETAPIEIIETADAAQSRLEEQIRDQQSNVAEHRMYRRLAGKGLAVPPPNADVYRVRSDPPLTRLSKKRSSQEMMFKMDGLNMDS